MSDRYFFDLAVYDRATHSPILKVRKFNMNKLDDTVKIVKEKFG